MDFKKFWSESLGGFILKRILLATAILVALSWITLYLVDIYTQHGHTETVPDLKGMYMEEAELMLKNHSLYAQVIDSVYVRNKKPGTIIDQSPAPNEQIKSNRPVYIVINSRQMRKTALPEIYDISYRQADAMLKSQGINVDNVQYTPSEYKDLVIDVKYEGRSITAGYRIPEGSYVTLVVGSGEAAQDTIVPSLKGMGIEEARTQAIEATMILGSMDFDIAPRGRESEYIIYRQRPAAGQTLPAGTRIDIWLSKDKSMLNKVFEEDKKENDTEEDFF